MVIILIVKPLSRMKIREKAVAVRKLADSPVYFDILKFIENDLAILDPESAIVILPDSEMKDAYAKAFPDLHLIQIRESVYNQAVKGDYRHRFTLCHELGHYLMHGAQNIVFPRSERKPFPFENPEWQANTFAGELLVPPEIAAKYEENEITTLCGASYTGASIQKIHNRTKK